MEEPPRQNRDDKNGSDETAAAATPGEIRFMDDTSFSEDLTRILYQPWPRSEEAIESSLSVIPWKILLLQETTSTTTCNHKTSSEEATTASSSAKTADNTKLSPSIALSPLAALEVSFPSISYLDLRRKQNLCFADDQCSKAQQNLDKGSPSAARAAWKQALELVPDHLPSLVGYGRFLLQIGKLKQSMELVNEALTIDPKHSLAETLLSELLEIRHQTHQHRPYVTNTMPHYNLLPNHQRDDKNNNKSKSKPNNPIALTTRKSSAYQDALLERQLLASPPSRDDLAVADSNPERDLSLVHSDPGTDELSLSQSERNHRKKNKKDRRHRDHKDRRQKKRRRKEHRKRHHRKRHSRRSKYYSSDDDGSYDGSSSDEDSSSRFSSRSKDSSRSRRSAVSTRHSVPKQESSLMIPKKQDSDDETNHSENPHEAKRARENEDESDDDEGSSVSKRHRKRNRKKKRLDERSHKREPRTKKESSRKRRHHRKRHKRTKNDSASSSSR